MEETFTFIVPTDAAGQRLDAYLTGLLIEQSRGAVQRLIDDGQVLVAGYGGSYANTDNNGNWIATPYPVIL